jgi:general secretion pathway protein K
MAKVSLRARLVGEAIPAVTRGELLPPAPRLRGTDRSLTLPRNNTPRRDVKGVRPQQGIALLIVLFVVALASIIVINLSYSTFIQARTIGMIERQLQAEYVLKSLVNFSAQLIALDDTDVTAARQPWGMFKDGVEVPRYVTSSLGIQDPSLRAFLEITPENGRIQLQQFFGRPDDNPAWYDALAKLFENMGFDDESNEQFKGGLFPNEFFNSKQMVSNLFDYIDENSESSTPPGAGFSPGIESQLPKKELFKNRRIERIEELALIPGFTPARLRAVAPFLSTVGSGFININVASRAVLRALPDFTDEMADKIIEVRESEDGPFESTGELQKKAGIDSQIYGKLPLEVRSKYFQVIAKVEYGNQASYFMKATLFRAQNTAGTAPAIRDPVLY